MAINSKKAGASKSEIISVFLVYVMLIVLIYNLTREVLLGMPSGSSGSNLLVIPAAFILPLALLIYVLINARKLHLDIKGGSPGARFKTQLVISFSAIILLISVPQTIVSMRFVNTAINTWFSPEIGSAITGGLNLSLAYYNEKIETLEYFGEGPAFDQMLSDLERSPQRMWTNMHNSNPGIDAIQIFSQDGSSQFFSGRLSAELERVPSIGGSGGLLPREDLESVSLLRYFRIYQVEDRSYSVVISSLLPRNLDNTARSLTEAREVFLTYQKNQKEFTALLYLFYAFFTIPLILISILISFLLSDEVIRPIVSLEAATRRVSEGDYSYRILTRSGDELSNLIKSFNNMMGELENSRKKILQTEKITAWQDIARQLAHELRNPLTPIKLSAERIQRKYRTDPENIDRVLEPAIKSIIQEVSNLDNLLKEFRDFSKLPPLILRKGNICGLIKEVFDSYKSSYPNIVFSYIFPEYGIVLDIDPKQIETGVYQPAEKQQRSNWSWRGYNFNSNRSCQKREFKLL